MGHIILQPTADKEAQIHYTNTIENPVNIDRIVKFVDEQTKNKISQLYPDGLVYVWGVKNGKKNVNYNKWLKMEPGDFVLFAKHKKIFSTGVVTYKLINFDLAKELWGTGIDGETWENIYLIDEIKAADVSYEKFNEMAGYSPESNIQGFNVLKEDISENVVNRLQLYSDYYNADISDNDFINEVEKLMKSNLDTITSGTSRKEQSYLRKKLFGDKKQEKCVICGEMVPTDLLVTAHIKKRADCTKEERLDIQNIVVPMCKLGCDDLYEKGYILVENGIIEVNRNKYQTPRLGGYLSLLQGKKCDRWNPDMDKYFKYHNDSVRQVERN